MGMTSVVSIGGKFEFPPWRDRTYIKAAPLFIILFLEPFATRGIANVSRNVEAKSKGRKSWATNW
jgi:hypothetical protein